MYLRYSTASQEICLGRMLDSTDGNTQETGLTINNTDIKLFKHGATSLTDKNSGGATHMANGLYYAVLDDTDTNTLGNLEVHVHVSGALTIKREFVVLPAQVFDSFVLGSDLLQVDTTQVGGTPQTGRDLGASVLLSNGTGTGQISLSSGTVTTGTNNDKTGYTVSTVSDKTGYSLSSAGIQAIWDALSSALTTAGSIGKRLVDYLTGDIFARIGAPAGASVSADIAAVKSDTGTLTGRLTATRAGYLDQLEHVADHLDTIVGKTANIPASPAAVSDIPTAAAIADQVWDEVQSGHTTAGTFGKYLDAQVSTVGGSSLTVEDIRAEIDSNSTQLAAIKAKTDNIPADPATETSISNLNDFDPANDTVAHVTLVDTTSVNTDMVSVAAISSNVLSIKGKTDLLTFTGTDVHSTASVVLDQDDIDGIAAGVSVGIFDVEVPGNFVKGTAGYALGHPLVTLPVLTGGLYTAVAKQSREVLIMRGDTPTVYFDLNGDYTGWTPYFGAKVYPGDEDYAIALRQVTWTDDSAGTGYMALTTSDTASAGKYHGEIELRNGGEVMTVIKFVIYISQDIIV